LRPDHLEKWSFLHHPQEPENPVTVVRTPEFLRWRLLDSPFFHQYRFVELPESGLRAIVRLIKGRTRRAVRILSVSGLAGDEGEIDRLLGSIVRWSLAQDADLVQMVHGDPLVILVARRWFPFRSTMRHVYYCNDTGAQHMLDDRPHLWEMLDSDFDLAGDGFSDASGGA
jgi:hypothetical protein